MMPRPGGGVQVFVVVGAEVAGASVVSIRAANELEGVVLDDYPGDERFDELGEVLALYAPGLGIPYSDKRQVREIIRRTIADLDLRERPQCAQMPRSERPMVSPGVVARNAAFICSLGSTADVLVAGGVRPQFELLAMAPTVGEDDGVAADAELAGLVRVVPSLGRIPAPPSSRGSAHALVELAVDS